MLRFFVAASAFALAWAPSTVGVEGANEPATATVPPEECVGAYADPGDGFRVLQVEPDITADPDQNLVVETAWALDQAIFRARNRSDPTEPGLRTFATKDVVTEVVNTVEWQLSLCRGVIGSSLTYIHHVRLDGDAATVSQCFVETLIWFDLRTGNVLDEAGQYFRTKMREFTQVDGQWQQWTDRWWEGCTVWPFDPPFADAS